VSTTFGRPPMDRDAFLEAPIGKLQDCVLAVRCFEGCERPAACSLRRVTIRCGPRIQLRLVIRRLRCSGCRRPPAGVAITDAANGGATWRVELMQ
jgi:hypothetical protein